MSIEFWTKLLQAIAVILVAIALLITQANLRNLINRVAVLEQHQNEVAR